MCPHTQCNTHHILFLFALPPFLPLLSPSPSSPFCLSFHPSSPYSLSPSPSSPFPLSPLPLPSVNLLLLPSHRMLHLYKKLEKALDQLDYFTQNEWHVSHLVIACSLVRWCIVLFGMGWEKLCLVSFPFGMESIIFDGKPHTIARTLTSYMYAC